MKEGGFCDKIREICKKIIRSKKPIPIRHKNQKDKTFSNFLRPVLKTSKINILH